MTNKRRRGRITGKHVQVNSGNTIIIQPRDGVGVFFTTEAGALGVALQLDDPELGHVLIPLSAADLVGVFRLLEWVVRMDAFELDQLIERVGNRGEPN
jgi:hypothetical protein